MMVPTHRTGQIAEGNDSIGRAQALRGHDRRQYLGDAGEPGALPQAQHQPQQQQRGKGVGEADQDGSRRPQGQSGSQYSMRAVALGQPADGNLREGVGPEKRRHQHTHLNVVHVQIGLHEVRRRRQCAAIDVVDEQHRRQQENDGAAGGPRRVQCVEEGGVQLA